MITSRLPRLAAAAALVCGVSAWIVFLERGLVLTHYDAKAHLVVARRVIDNITPGWQQLGAVWLPLPHLLQILPTQVDLLYRTGASASIVSIAAFTLAVWAAVRLVLRMTRSAYGAILTAALLIGNPNLLYLQSTPMTEPLLLGTLFLTLLWLHEWLERFSPASAVPRVKTPNPVANPDALPAKLGWALVAAAWTRYEAWLIIAAALFVALLTLLQTGVGARRALALTARAALWPAAAAVVFLVNSKVTTGQWFVTGGFYEVDATYHRQAAKSLIAVWWGTHRLIGYVVESVACAVVIFLLVKSVESRSLQRLVPVTLFASALLPLYGFYEGHPFRVRYMVTCTAASALLCGIGIGLLRRRGVALIGAAAVLAAAVIEAPPLSLNAAMIQEAQWDVPRILERRTVTDCLRSEYGGEKILASMGSLAHYMQELSAAGFRIADFIHEGNGDLWQFALTTGPAAHAGWMLVEEQSEGGDILARKFQEDAAFGARMTRVCAAGGVALYRRQ